MQRVLAWNAWPTGNGEAAAFAIGDTALATCTVNEAPSASTLREPRGVFTDGTRILVADSGNHRVLSWSSWPGASGVAADRTLGQVDATSAGPFALRSSNPVLAWSSPSIFWGGLHAEVDPGGGLWLLSGAHHNLMRFATTPTSDQPPASFIYGQSNETYTWCNGATATVSATSLCRPSDMWTDGTRYLLADTGNHRVLVWNTPPSGPTDAPDLVLGQAGFTTNASALSAGGMNQPAGVTSDGTRIAVADYGNHRVLVWNSWPTINGQSPSLVLGQPDFVTGTSNNGGPSASSIGSPTAVASADGRLAVSDVGGRRVMVWSTWPTTNFAAATGVYGQDSMTANACLDACGVNSIEVVGNALLFSAGCTVNVVDPVPVTTAVATGHREIADGCLSSSTAANAIGSPWGIGARAGSVWIADGTNSRVVRFDDTVNPVITDAPRVLANGTSVDVRWRTSESGIAAVYWDTVSRASPGLYANSQTATAATGLEHSRTITGLTSGTWFYRVATTDWAGRQVVSGEYTFTIGGPSVTDNQTGDTTWRRMNIATYDVDVSDADGIDRIELRAWSDTGQSGTLVADWTTLVASPGTSWTVNWTLPTSMWDALPEGTSYVSLRANDVLGRWTMAEDLFYVRKDTVVAAPANVIDGNTVDEATRSSTTSLEASWNTTAGEDRMSGVARYDYCFGSLPDCGGTVLVPWTSAAGATTILRTGLSLTVGERWYAAVRTVDVAGNVSAVVSSDGVAIGATGGSTSIGLTSCSGSALSLGSVVPGVTATTGTDCQVAFGASGSTAELRIRQSDRRGVAASTQTTGQLDPTFASGGRVEVDGLGDWDEEYGHGLEVMRDGRILRTGDRSPALLSVMRFTTDGRLDLSFGTAGWAIVSAPGSASGSAVIEQPDGRLLLCGSLWATTPDRMIVARLQPDGALDTTFGGGTGYVTHSTNADTADTWLTQCRQQRDGRILLVGYQDAATRDDIVVKRLLADGTTDTSYGGGDGIVTVPTQSVTMYNFFGYGAELDSEERLMIAGNQWNATTSSTEFVVMRFTNTGVLDTTYAGGDGIYSWDFSSLDDRAQDLIVHSNGAVTAVGTTQDFDAYGLVQLDPTGAPDTSFGGAGTGRREHVFNADGWTEAFTIARQPDGRLLVG
ncbi:MAG TPA: hypothetical protein VM344_01800, partial [Vitreimonas sp.]|nr:hypothetical protein [Vitreimonas sp.]